MRGDPLATYLRRLLSSGARRPSAIAPNVEQANWLREQFEIGALPRDPDLIRSLVEQAPRRLHTVT